MSNVQKNKEKDVNEKYSLTRDIDDQREMKQNLEMEIF